jgi:hypothetical protein
MLREFTTALAYVSAVSLAGNKSGPANCLRSFSCALALSVGISVAAHVGLSDGG